MQNMADPFGEDVCAGCHQTGRSAAEDVVPLQQLWYHSSCVPVCHCCGRPLQAGEEDRWMYEAEIVSAPWGYAVNPTRCWCRQCWDATPRDEPPALD